MTRPPRTPTPVTVDLDRARQYLSSRIAELSPERFDQLCVTMGVKTSTVASWRAGQTVPHKRTWAALSVFFREEPDAMMQFARVRTTDSRFASYSQ